MGHPAKVLGEQSSRGFESLTLRLKLQVGLQSSSAFSFTGDEDEKDAGCQSLAQPVAESGS